MERDGRGMFLHDVVRQHVEGFGGRVSISGPQVLLKPSASQGFALILHELSTNAVKFGALAAPSGMILVSWSVDDALTGNLVFNWVEQGGPPVLPPDRKGFGTVLLKHAVASASGPPALDYAPSGFSYRLAAAHAMCSDAERLATA